MKKVLWWSRGRHLPTAAQVEELRRIFGGEVEFVYRFGLIRSAEEVIKTYIEDACNGLVLIGPLGVIVKVAILGSDHGIIPLRAKMVRVEGPREDDYFDQGTQTYVRFDSFEWVKGLNTEPA